MNSRPLSVLLVGLCYALLVVPAWWPKKPEVIVVGMSEVPKSFSAKYVKLYTDRIEPEVAPVVLATKKAAETKMVRQLPKATPVNRVAAKRTSCKPGRTRNSKGQCGKWNE
jgi:xanthosine utilization system XapX-like protein